MTANSLALYEPKTVSVLKDTLYPGASDDAIAMVLDYCTARRLDPLQKPVHLVPMPVKIKYKDDKGNERFKTVKRDVVMPGISLYRIQAARTGELAGIGEPEFGPMKTMEYYKTVWVRGPNGDDEPTKAKDPTILHYPEWCRIVVKRRSKDGFVSDYVATEFWLENYATKNAHSDEPNEMWATRTRGQLAKCAEAQALRRGFPDAVGNEPTAEEMDGKQMHYEEPQAEHVVVQQPQPKSKPKDDVVDVEIRETVTVTPQTTASPPEGKPVSAGILKSLKLKATNKGITDDVILAKFGVTLDGLTTLQFNAVSQYIDAAE